MSTIESLRWNGARLELLDQRELPHQQIYVRCSNEHEVARAITDMVIRGAPAIGCAAAYGIALAALDQVRQPHLQISRLATTDALLRATRPTAVNLAWALDQMAAQITRYRTEAGEPADVGAAQGLANRLIAFAAHLHAQDITSNQIMGQHGAALIPRGARILTHCNTGALATAGHGTALGVVRSTWQQGNPIHVWVCETRPYLQGARLTAWELLTEGIPMQLISDTMAGHFMQRGEVDLVIVGADRIAANGDVANKIGTYTLAVLAARHQIPFYVAAPLSTYDAATAHGADIPIEERAAHELTGYRDQVWAPHDVAVRNPAFDVTPAELVSAIITESGVARAPYRDSLAALAGNITPDECRSVVSTRPNVPTAA